MTLPGARRAPLSAAQARLEFIDRRDGATAAYTTIGAFRLGGALDPAILERALQAVVDRHESLRTRFVVVDGEPTQVIETAIHAQLDRRDLRGMAAAEQEVFLDCAIRQERQRPFILSSAPLFRALLLAFAEHTHVLILTWHHIVCDAWSYNLFLNELLDSYGALVHGTGDPLPALSLQYANVVERERQWMDSTGTLTAVAYWKQQLQGIPERLELPVDRPRAPGSTFDGDVARVSLSREETDALKRWGREHGVTLYVMLLAAYGALLGRYAGQDDVVVGMPVAHRPDRETQHVIGLLVNLLPIRMRLSLDLRCGEFVKSVQLAVLEALRHQRLPFDRIVEEVAPTRSSSLDPLCQVVLSPLWTDFRAASELTVERLTIDNPSAPFDIEVVTQEQDGALVLSWIYKTALFDRWRIEQQARHHLSVLSCMSMNPDARIEDIEVLSAGERAQILQSWNGTDRRVADVSLPTLLEAQAARTPDVTAIAFRDQRVSYRRLNARANQLARELIARGIGPEDVVALAMPRSVEMITSLIGVLKAGAAYLPLDLAHPTDRLSFMLSDAAPSCILTAKEVAGGVPQPALHVVVDDAGISSALNRYADSDLDDRDRTRRLTPSCAAYVIYTSGTTGRPKGVVGLHRGAVNRLSWFAEDHPFGSGEPALAKSSLAFLDASTEILAPLTGGGTVVLADDDAARDPAALRRLIALHDVKRITLVPSLLAAIIADDAGDSLHSCRLWICSGEALPLPTVAAFCAHLPDALLLNLYGVSEASADSLFAACAGSDAPLGRPIWNTKVYVLDDGLDPVPPGVPGELYIAGVGLARGYLRRAALTAEKFVANPYGPPGSRMYRTGDLVRWRPNGTLEFCGRRDDLVKIRGCRVELQEIQWLLARTLGVSEAFVATSVDHAGETRLTAYVALEPGAAVDAAVLRQRLAHTLPSYMVPSAITLLDKLPRTSSGKVDRAALPRTVTPPTARERSTERSEEATLCAIFADVLGLDHVEPEDDFFESGGHSLMATRLVNRIRLSLGVDVPLRRVFEAPTPAGLAEDVRQLASAAVNPSSAERSPRV